ncbi:MAG: hypothetical protein AAGC55_03930 [Myxococcota bacterium]
MGRSALLTVATTLSLATTSGCSSPVVKHQSKVLQSYSPATLESRGAFEGEPTVVEVRVHADQDYRALRPTSWKREFESHLDLANQLLVPEFGIRLEVSEFKQWQRKANSDAISEAMDELRKLDPGTDTEVVIGLLAALPRVTTDMSELGAADLNGKHIVIRGFNHVAEHKAFAEPLDALSEEELDRFFLARKQHRQSTLILHEFGHLMGVGHVTDASKTLMRPVYSAKVSSYAPQTIEQIRTALAARREQPATAANEQEPEGEKEKNGGKSQQPPIPPEAVDIYQRVLRLNRDGKIDAAADELDGLLSAYPATVEFRLLACQLWIKKEGPVDTAAGHCRRIGELQASDARGELVLAAALLEAKRPAEARAVIDQAAKRAPEIADPETQTKLWAALLGFYRGLNAVTWAEALAQSAPPGPLTEDTAKWASRLRRRYGLPPGAAKLGIAPEREGDYIVQVRSVLNLVYGKQYSEAKKLAKQGLRSYRNAPGLLGALCDLEVRSKRFDAARPYCLRAVRGYPDASWPLYLLGIIELRYRRNQAGIGYLKRSIAADPDLKQAYRALSKAYARRKDLAARDKLRETYQQRFGEVLP